MLNPNVYESIIKACWELAEKGTDALTNDKIAAQAGLYEVEINALFPEKKHVLLALLADLKSKTELVPYHPEVPGDEQFFDGVMSYYDVAKPHKEALKKLSQDLLWNPLLAFSVTPKLQHLVNELANRYYPAPADSSPLMMGRQWVQQMAYQALLLRIFYVWLADDSFDASKTMAALDQGIKQATECKTWF